ncbi:MAG: hypothetical protein IJX76_03700 [Clostridia bacterium]|nr:hypothetical protein [Clostridia bacterium]
MKGKDKCKILKEIRAQIAAANDIEWVTENCTHKGECRGTCPKCEAEVLTLERELARRRTLGKSIAVVGLSAGIITTATACSDPTPIEHTVPAGQETDAPTDIVVETEGDLVFAGAPLSPPIEVDGDMAPVYYTTDFIACEPRIYIADRLLYVDHLQDFDYSDENVWAIPEGEMFVVIGTGEDDRMVRVLYGGQQFVMWEDDLDLLENEVATGIAEPTDPT